MTEKEIITLLKNNEKGFMFLPKEVQEWADKHRCNMRRFNYNDMSWTTQPDVFCESNVYRLQPDYPETAPLPELEEGLYYLSKKDGSVWMFGEYTEIFGIEDGRYGFRQARDSKSFTIDPAKWNIKKILTENVK